MMNIKQLLRTFLVVALLGTLTCQALIHKVNIWYNRTTKQYLILCDDIHMDVKNGLATAQQKEAIITWAAKLGITILIEDLGTLPETPSAIGLSVDSALWKNLTRLQQKHDEIERKNPNLKIKNSRGDRIKLISMHDSREPIKWHDAYSNSTMNGLIPLCKSKHIPIYNVECRYRHNTYFVSAASLVALNEALIKTILSWENDPVPLRDFYFRSIINYRNNSYIKALVAHAKSSPHNHLKTMLYTHVLYSAYTQCLSRKSVDAYKAKLEHNVHILDSSFLDAYLLHALATHRTEPLLLSLCGGAHHTSLQRHLHLLGFEELIGCSFGGEGWNNHGTNFGKGHQYIIPVVDMDYVFKVIELRLATKPINVHDEHGDEQMIKKETQIITRCNDESKIHMNELDNVIRAKL